MLILRNAVFAREGRCLFAEYSQSLRDCSGCRTLQWCPYHDRAQVREAERLAIARSEDEGAHHYPNQEPFDPIYKIGYEMSFS
jgi:hypothetical protein